MDILADILKNSGLRKRILHQTAIYAPWAMEFPCAKSIGFHVVTQGNAWLWQPDSAEPIPLRRGDIAFMARGMSHHLTTTPDPGLLARASDMTDDVSALPSSVFAGQVESEPLLALVSGAFQLWYEPIHPLFHELPAWVILRSDALPTYDSLYFCLQLISAEVNQPKLGSELIIDSLLDVLFNLILRKIISMSGQEAHSWSHSLRDPVVVKALETLHSDCSQDWTLQALAAEVGLSRSGFAARFKQALGDSPLHYLTLLRMQKARELLAQSDDTLETIAAAVGYSDAFGFSKTFKKTMGISPRDFRRQNQQDRDLAWHFV
jgi:AraC-like DNA-binding protein